MSGAAARVVLDLPDCALAAYALGGRRALRELVLVGAVEDGEYACPGTVHRDGGAATCTTCQGAATVKVRTDRDGSRWLHGGWM